MGFSRKDLRAIALPCAKWREWIAISALVSSGHAIASYAWGDKSMPITEVAPHAARHSYSGTMLANVFHRSGRFGLEERPIPSATPTEAVIKTRLTTICGTDLHIVRGEYPVEPGLTIGHEAVGTIYE